MLNLFQYISLYGQQFADKEYYLVDSLDIESLTDADKELIENSLKEYHKAKDDTSKIKALTGICENMMDPDWTKYQLFQYHLIQKSLKKQHSKLVTQQLKISLAGALNNIGVIYSDQGDKSKALEYYHKSLKIQKEIGAKKDIASSLNNIGVLYGNQGDITNSLKYLIEGLKIQEEIGNKSGTASSLNNIGYIYSNQGDIPKALEYYHKSLKIREEIGEKRGVADCIGHIGSIYNSQGDISKALEYYHKGLKIQEEIGEKRGAASNLNNIGGVYKGQGDISKALEYYHKSLKIQEEVGDKIGAASSLNNIGSSYDKQGDLSKALEYHHKSLKIREGIGEKRGVAISLANIGGIELKGDVNGLSSAKKHLIRSLNLSKEIGYPKLISNASRTLSTVYKKQGKGLMALEMYQLHITMRDSVNNETTLKAVAQQQAKYTYEKKKALDDAENEKLIAIEQEAKAKQTVITYAISAGLGLVVLFLIFVFYRLRIAKKQKSVIEIQKNEVEYQRDEIEEAHKEITDSINYAERIQRSFMATKEVLDENLKDYFVFFKPKEVVSGDFYWAGKLHNGNFALVNADSTGHGVPGAIMSILNISSIEKAVEQNLVNTSEIFNATRKTIIERLKNDGSADGGKDGMDASIISFDFRNQKFTYTAANNPILVVRKHAQSDDPQGNEREIIIITPDKMPLGKHDNDSTPFSQGEFELQKGDVIYTITDGFQDQFGGEKGKKFMAKKLRNLLLSIAHLPMEEQKQKLNNVFFNWKGDEDQVDDICIIGVRI